MHLSLALQAGCDGFATNDRGFAKAEDLIDIIPLPYGQAKIAPGDMLATHLSSALGP